MANKQTTRKPTRQITRHPQQVAALNNLLNQLVENLSMGYSDEAWTQTSRSMRRLSGYLHQADREILATAWRNCYVDHSLDEIHSAVDKVRARL
jgi:hypothetical protein